MDADVIAAQLRSAVFPDRWTECTTWASGLESWHSCVRVEDWSSSEGYEEEHTAGVKALIACALHQAAGDDTQQIRRTPLARAARLLVDAPTTVATVDSLPEAPPREVASHLAAVVKQLEHGNVEIKAQILHTIGRAHQVLAAHAAHGMCVDERIPALARAANIGIALTDGAYAHPAYPGAPSLSRHLALVRQLRESHALAKLSGQPWTPADRRAQLLQTAAATDRWLLAWGPDDQPAQRAEQARAVATALLQHDQEHGTGAATGDRRTGSRDPLTYVREQYALWIGGTLGQS